jgi:hypothetical protein
MSGELKPKAEAERPPKGQPFEPDPDSTGVGRHKKKINALPNKGAFIFEVYDDAARVF